MSDIPGERRRSDLPVRAATGVVAIAVALGCLWTGGIAWWLLVSAAALLMMTEWAGLIGASRPKRVLALVLIAAWLLQIAAADAGHVVRFGAGDLQVHLSAGGDQFYPNLLLLAAVALLAGLVGLSLRLALGVLYVGLPAAGLLYLRSIAAWQGAGLGVGAMLTLWTLAVVWATDIGAYFAGRAIGGPKLAPRVSPNKTWAGLGGGIVLALAVGGAIASMGRLPWALLWLGAPMAVLAQAGDLYESAMKRRAGVKDSGRFLPGHGGALDRLDGLVPVAAAVAALLAGGWL